MAQPYQQFSPLNALATVQQQGEIGRQRGINSQLNQLASLASTAPREQQQAITSQAYGIDRAGGAEIQKQVQSQEDRTYTVMGNMAKMLLSVPPEAQERLYNDRMLPELHRMGVPGAPRWAPDTRDAILDSAMKLRDARFGASSGGASGVQSTYVNANGQRVAIMRDGSTQILGDNDPGVTGQTLTIDVNGVPTQVTFDRRTQRYTTATLDPSPQPSQQAPNAPAASGNHFADFNTLVQEFPGATMTSGVRTAERNAQVGGQPNSQHLTGTAADFAMAPGIKPAFMARVRQMGYTPIDEGDHVHIQMPRGATAPAPAQAAPVPLVGRTKEAEAAATEAAKLRAQLDALPDRIRMENEGAIDRAAGIARVEADAKDAAQRPKKIQGYQQALAAAGNVQQSIDRALGLISPVSTGFGGARLRSVEGSDAFNLAAELETIKANLGFDRLQQMRDSSPTGGALGAIAVQELVALQSTIANLDPNQSEDQIRANLQRVATHYANWRKAVQQAIADEQSAAQAAPSARQSPAPSAQQSPAPSAQGGASDYSNLWN